MDIHPIDDIASTCMDAAHTELPSLPDLLVYVQAIPSTNLLVETIDYLGESQHELMSVFRQNSLADETLKWTAQNGTTFDAYLLKHGLFDILECCDTDTAITRLQSCFHITMVDFGVTALDHSMLFEPSIWKRANNPYSFHFRILFQINGRNGYFTTPFQYSQKIWTLHHG